MIPQTILVTGASTGFGRLIARALALDGHTVYAGMYTHSGNTQPHEDEIAQFSRVHSADLRPVPLDLLSEPSISAAITHILSTSPTHRLDTVIHNAGHMSFGPTEAFSAAQLARLYDINVLGPHRLNTAFLPHMRARRAGHVIWISSSSVYGAKSPMLGPYFAAKAAMDSLAVTLARELNFWGVESSVVNPGVFTKGTRHFDDAMEAENGDVEREYEEGPTRGLQKRTMEGTAGVVPEHADPEIVAERVVELVRLPRGSKPLRVFADPVGDGCEEAATLVDRKGDDFYRRMGMEDVLKVSL